MISSVSSSTSTNYAPATGQGSVRAGSSDKSTASEKTDSQKKADERTIATLVATDRKVRTHEAAHLAAAGGLAISGASFTYTTGPDGKRYAVGGEVNIDVSPADTPAATITKADNIRRAALAPADPSAQDQAVAAMAGRMGAEARLELSREQAAAYTQTEPGKKGKQLDVMA